MRFLPARLNSLWRRLSFAGVTEEIKRDYPSARRIVLINQVSILGILLLTAYTLFFAIYLLDTLWMLILVNPFFCLGFAGVIYLNHRGVYLLARIALILIPCLLLTHGAWLVSERSGIQLYFFALWAVLFLLFRREDKLLFTTASTLFIGLYLAISYYFEQPRVAISDAYLTASFVINAVGTFVTIGLAIRLFYEEINRTEMLLQSEYQRSEDLLLNILPAPIATRLKNETGAIADRYESVTVLFADIADFTQLARSLDPDEVVELLSMVFARFDKLVNQNGLEKIKTVGDAYMLAGGIPEPLPDHCKLVARVALQMMEVIERLNRQIEHQLSIRIGIHTGPVVAGVIGTNKFSYDVWGNAVNVASRMQTQSEPGRIQVSEAVYEILKDDYEFKERGRIDVKGVGKMKTYFLEGRSQPKDWSGITLREAG